MSKTLASAWHCDESIFGQYSPVSPGLRDSEELQVGNRVAVIAGAFTTHAFYWAMPEMIQALVLLFWLVSTLERNRTTSILVTDKLKEVSQNASLTYSFVTPWGSYSYDLLDKRYFKFADSFVSYQVLP